MARGHKQKPAKTAQKPRSVKTVAKPKVSRTSQPKPAPKPAKAPKAVKKAPVVKAAPVAPLPVKRVVSDEVRRAAIAEAAEKAREKLWAEQGQPITTVQGVTIAFAQLSRSKPHWHLLTFGLALDGLELSIRVLKGKDELAPPAWPVTLLTGLISRARAKDLSADTNQVVLLSDGIAPPAADPTTGLTPEMVGLVFTPDPEVQKLVTPHDTVPVLLAVPITRDEVRVVREWSPSGLVEVLAKVDPLLITDLERASLLQSPRARALIEQRVEREGSSLSNITTDVNEASRTGKKVTWKLPVEAIETFVSLLKGRIGHLRPFSISSPTFRAEVVNADQPSVQLDGNVLTLKLNLVGARQLRSSIRAKAGTYTFDALPDFELVVVTQ